MPPRPPEVPLLAAPEPMLLLAAPEPRWKKHAKPATAIALAAVMLLAFAIGWFLHHRRAEAAKDANEEERNALPLLTVVPAKRSPGLSEMLLPGSLSPITEASLYARASGYVQHRYADIGDAVQKGQVLAEIESPDLDQQVAQGRAGLAQARQQVNQAQASVGDAQARVDLARVTVQRYETLLAQDSIARQDVDVQRQTYQSALAALASARANVGAAEENVRASEANVRRLVALQRFEQVRAPFDGIITARSFDEGALISAAGASLGGGGSGNALPSTGTSPGSPAGGSGGDSASTGSAGSGAAGGSGDPLFRIAQVDRLRVYVYVPQENAAAIELGAEATVLVQQFADRFTGRVARTSRSIDPVSRTLLAEVQLPNAGRTLMPGMYAQVRFASQRSNPPLLVPGETLIARSAGTQVATLAPLGEEDRSHLADSADAQCARKIHLLPVTVGRDYGTEVEISRGLRGSEFLLLNPGDTAREGTVVLPELQKKDAGESKEAGDKKAGGSRAGDTKAGPEQALEAQKKKRQQARSTCIDEQYRQSQASAGDHAGQAPAPAGESAPASNPASQPAPGGPSDQAPGGNQSPSMKAPSQGAQKKGGKP